MGPKGLSKHNFCSTGGTELNLMGSDFYIAFAPTISTLMELGIAVTTNELTGANFTLECSNSLCVSAGFPLSYSIQNEEAVTIRIPDQLSVVDSSERDFAIHLVVHDEKKVGVFGYYDVIRNDMSNVYIPCDSIKRTIFDQYEYLTLHTTYPNSSPERFNLILMIPCEDMTTITVHPSQDISISFSDLFIYNSVTQAGPTLPNTFASFIANSGDTMLIETVDDLSGSIIVSNKPLVVYAGHSCAQIPATVGFCDHIYEQIPPSFTYGTTFFLTPLAYRETGDIYRVGTCLNGTEVNFTCITPGQSGQNVTYQNATIDRGQWMQFTTNGNPTDEPDWQADFCTLESNYPVLVMQYSQGRLLDDALTPYFELGDPSMGMIPPITQFSNNYTLINFIERITNFGLGYVNLAVHSNFAANVSLRSNSSNNITIIDSGWNPFYCHNGTICGWGIQVLVDDYLNFLDHNDPDPEAAVGVIVYGFEYGGTLSTVAGMTLTPIGGE